MNIVEFSAVCSWFINDTKNHVHCNYQFSSISWQKMLGLFNVDKSAVQKQALRIYIKIKTAFFITNKHFYCVAVSNTLCMVINYNCSA